MVVLTGARTVYCTAAAAASVAACICDYVFNTMPMQGFTPESINVEQFLNLRYDGTDVAIMTKLPAAAAPASSTPAPDQAPTSSTSTPAHAREASAVHSTLAPSSTADASAPCTSYRDAFEATYRREFGFVLGRGVWVDDVRVRATGRSRPLLERGSISQEPGELRTDVHSDICWFMLNRPATMSTCKLQWTASLRVPDVLNMRVLL